MSDKYRLELDCFILPSVLHHASNSRQEDLQLILSGLQQHQHHPVKSICGVMQMQLCVNPVQL